MGAAGAPAGAQDAGRGKVLFADKCARCHAITGKNDFGPNLKGVVGRKAAKAKGFDYSPAMKHSAIVWDWASLNAYLAQPRLIVPRTAMPNMAGVADPQDRDDLIEYLKTAR